MPASTIARMDEATQIEIRERLNEFVREAMTAADRGSEALEHLKQGRPQDAYGVILSAHSLERYLAGIRDAFAAAGISPRS